MCGQSSAKRTLHRLIIVIVFSAMQLHGQTDSTASHKSLSEGVWALEFGVSSNFTLTSFQGSVLSVKYHPSATRAIRVSISGEASSSSEEEFGTERFVSKHQTVEITSAYLFYSPIREDLYLFWGFGPSVGYDRSYEKYPTTGTPDYDVTRITELPEWNVGASIALGAEWFAVKWLSLHAEYGISATYTWGKFHEVFDHEPLSPPLPAYSLEYENRVIKSWEVRPTSVRFGVSVYL